MGGLLMEDAHENKARKRQLQLLPPDALFAIAGAMEEGARKYGAASWRQTGISASDYAGSMMRHLLAWQDGQSCDKESGLLHLAHLAACCMVVLDAMSVGMLKDDLPYPRRDDTTDAQRSGRRK